MYYEETYKLNKDFLSDWSYLSTDAYYQLDTENHKCVL